ncbi:MAG: type II toxin-antitoxin system VapC family toxin [Candidatus Anammoxibacter sp.]
MENRFVIDNSIVMAWCFKDESSKYVDIILDSLKEYEAMVPAIWPLEVGNVVLVAERSKRLTEADSIRFLNLINELPIIVDQESPDRMLKEIFALARECHISSYDASYLDLAMRNGFPIATQDSGLKKAAKRCDVPLFNGWQK